MILISERYNHVSYDAIDEFEELISKNLPITVKSAGTPFSMIFYWFVKVFRKMHLDILIVPRRHVRKSPLYDDKHLFCIMMGLSEKKFMARAVSSVHYKSVFLFDAWPDTYDSIVCFCRRYHIDFLFITSKQSTAALSKRLPDTCVSYIPEAINLRHYHYEPPSRKDIDVLALGRKWDSYHNMIVTGLERAGVTYCYEKTAGSLIFPDRDSFIRGLSKSKISICIPSSITHPDRAGDVETMTLRYLQSIASKCLIVGIAPREMVELFGFDPVIRIDMEHPVEQIIGILSHFMDYQPFIDHNYDMIASHTWEKRIESIRQVWQKNSDMALRQ